MSDTPKWPIPRKPWGTRVKYAFEEASEETQAKFRELYPVSFNKEMAGWFGISECMVKYIGQRLGLRKDRSHISRRNVEPHKGRLCLALKRIRETDLDRYADLSRRRTESVRKAWHRARIQAEYGLPRTVRLHVALGGQEAAQHGRIPSADARHLLHISMRVHHRRDTNGV